MTSYRISTRLFALCLLMPLGLIGCGDEASDTHEDSHEAHAGAASEAPSLVREVERGQKGLIEVELTESTPSLKYVGMYTWRMTLRDTEGALINNAELVAEPTMPTHGHGTFPPYTPGSFDGEGTYWLVDMDLFMPGTWHIDIEVTWDGDKSDSLTYIIDLEG